MDIKDIKKHEISEMYDFLQKLEDYGHIYHFPKERLDSPFNKILEGMGEIEDLMEDSYGY